MKQWVKDIFKYESGDVVMISSHEGFGGEAVVKECRCQGDYGNVQYKVTMKDYKILGWSKDRATFWAYASEVAHKIEQPKEKVGDSGYGDGSRWEEI